MIVVKFGGTSVGSAERFKSVSHLVTNDTPKIVVLSAMSGTTNSLIEISKYLYNKKIESALLEIHQLEITYKLTIAELFSKTEFVNKAEELMVSHFNYIRSFTQGMFTMFEEKAILAQGELLSTTLFHLYLQELRVESVLLPALNFMRINPDHEPDTKAIKENIQLELSKNSKCKLFITQGFICRNSFGEIDNLKRGGSDYTASLIGAAINAKEIQIWTDIDGMHNNDPRIVNRTYPISHLSFDEAAELAYFGAKILHPSSVLPAKLNNIPVRLKNTLEPSANGTLISSISSGSGIKAVAAKDHITAIKIKSGRMLLAYGFMRKVFEIFEAYKTPIDMITTSEVAISITIDETIYLNEIVNELKKLGTVDTNDNLTIICVVGDFIAESKGYALKVFDALQDIPVRMISYGGSLHNISLLVHTSDKKEALISLNEKLFT